MRNPKENDCCKVLYEGTTVNARVIRVDNEAKTFNVVMEFGEPMFYIPFDKFCYEESIGNQIVNELAEKYSLDLKTIDAFDMTEFIDDLIFNNRWKVFGVIQTINRSIS